MSITAEFTDFIMKGNVIDLSIAVVIGLAFNAVVTAFVADIITPLIGIPGHLNFSTLSYTVNGSVFMVGLFINALISFITIALVIFLFVIKPVSKINEKMNPKPEVAPKTKECPECLSQIPIKAKRCAFCTSKVS
jgi:large conductance mechanosensitive channel